MVGFKINHNKFNIVILGTGGNGGNLIPTLSRFIYSMIDSKEYDILFTVVDGDIVEKGNLYRQHFTKGDLGKNKAMVFAHRYSNAFGIDINFVDTYIETEASLESLLTFCNRDYQYKGDRKPYLPVLIGCVDNNRSRIMMHNVFNKINDIVYIDAGNEKYSGQVVMGVRGNGKTLMPDIAEIFPEILEDKTSVFKSKEGCTRVAHKDDGRIDVEKMNQQLVTNATAATIILNFVANLMLGKPLLTNAVDFDTTNINVKPKQNMINMISQSKGS